MHTWILSFTVLSGAVEILFLSVFVELEARNFIRGFISLVDLLVQDAGVSAGSRNKNGI